MAGFGFGNVGFVGSLSGAPASVNRALVTAIGCVGTLPSNRATGFNLTTNWRIKVRLRQASGANYVMAAGASEANSLSLIWNFVANTYEIYGSADRFGLSLPVTDGLYHSVEFTYSGGIIRGFLDGVAAGSKTSAAFTSNVAATTALLIGTAANSNTFSGAYDYVIIDIDGANVVSLGFDEASGAATNTGSNGGVMSFLNGDSRELVP